MPKSLDALFEGLPSTLDVTAVAELLGLTPKAIYRMIENKTMPAYKPAGKWLILSADLKELIEQSYNQADAAD